MRLWSIHPSHLDQKGLGAAWREGLGAQKVIAKLQDGQKPGYAYHPQLKRFLEWHTPPLLLIGCWLTYIQEEATIRGYRYNKGLILYPNKGYKMPVTSGQLGYEFNHLLAKLKKRNMNKYWKCLASDIKPHPMFSVIEGPIENWEKVTNE